MRKFIYKVVELVSTLFALAFGAYLLLGDRDSIIVTIFAWIMVSLSVFVISALVIIGTVASSEEEK